MHHYPSAAYMCVCVMLVEYVPCPPRCDMPSRQWHASAHAIAHKDVFGTRYHGLHKKTCCGARNSFSECFWTVFIQDSVSGCLQMNWILTNTGEGLLEHERTHATGKCYAEKGLVSNHISNTKLACKPHPRLMIYIIWPGAVNDSIPRPCILANATLRTLCFLLQ